MTDTAKGVNTDLVKCEICLKEVPKSEAKISEAQDYVMHFCGLDCYDKWQKKCESDAKEDDR